MKDESTSFVADDECDIIGHILIPKKTIYSSSVVWECIALVLKKRKKIGHKEIKLN